MRGRWCPAWEVPPRNPGASWLRARRLRRRTGGGQFKSEQRSAGPRRPRNTRRNFPRRTGGPALAGAGAGTGRCSRPFFWRRQGPAWLSAHRGGEQMIWTGRAQPTPRRRIVITRQRESVTAAPLAAFISARETQALALHHRCDGRSRRTESVGSKWDSRIVSTRHTWVPAVLHCIVFMVFFVMERIL